MQEGKVTDEELCHLIWCQWLNTSCMWDHSSGQWAATANPSLSRRQIRLIRLLATDMMDKGVSGWESNSSKRKRDSGPELKQLLCCWKFDSVAIMCICFWCRWHLLKPCTSLTVLQGISSAPHEMQNAVAATGQKVKSVTDMSENGKRLVLY